MVRAPAADRERPECDGLDAVAVVREVVEDPAPVGLAPRLEHDHDVGVEAAHDPRDVETFAVMRAEAAGSPVRVERSDREFGQKISVPGPSRRDAAYASDADALCQ
jgi:hypothetical protein